MIGTGTANRVRRSPKERLGEVEVAVQLEPEVALVRLTTGHVQRWWRVESRKEHRCALCKTTIPKGSVVYAPLTNARNRMQRLCDGCVKGEKRLL